MWIFLPDAFFSIVCHRADPTVLILRARARGDIERYLPRAEVNHTPENDYPFRAEISRASFRKILAKAASGLDYPNFKGAVEEPDRHDAYLSVWSAMQRWQYRRSTPRLALDPTMDLFEPLGASWRATDDPPGKACRCCGAPITWGRWCDDCAPRYEKPTR